MSKKCPAFGLLLAFLWLALAGCQPSAFARISDSDSVLAVANVREKTVSFLETESGKTVATWKPDFSFARMLLLPDRHTVLLYGKNEEEAHTLDGKQKGEIKVGPSPLTMLLDEKKNLLYVVDLQDATLREIALADRRVTRTFRMNESPMGGLLMSDRKELWIGGHGRGDLPEEDVSVFSSETGQKQRTMDTHIKTLRMKLGEHAGLIQTVRGIGYKFEVQI